MDTTSSQDSPYHTAEREWNAKDPRKCPSISSMEAHMGSDIQLTADGGKSHRERPPVEVPEDLAYGIKRWLDQDSNNEPWRVSKH